MPSFDLIDEPWLPCVPLGGGEAQPIGLRDALARAAELREIVDPAPIVTVALYRLLLAILHRNFGPADAAAWTTLWERGSFDTARLNDYFNTWRHRFNLFDEQRPFYQVGGLSFDYAGSICKRVREIASTSNTTLFEHTLDGEASAATPAEAARFVVAHQAFAVGGLVSLEKGQDPKRFKSAEAAPLNKGAVALIKGNSLFETLMLNLHQYSCDEGHPFACFGEDRPAWERDGMPSGEARVPSGYLDLLTWQSRRIRLQPESGSDGRTTVRRGVIMKGDQFPNSWHRQEHETMLAFVKREKAAKNQDPWPAVAFREDRALWRDSLALVQSTGPGHARPMTLSWLGELVMAGSLDRVRTLAMDLYGLSTNQAAVNFWRHERLSVPSVYLDEPKLWTRLREALTLGEGVAQALNASSSVLARRLLAPGSDGPHARQPRTDAVRAFVGRLAPTRGYWARLEAPFRKLLVELPADRSTDEHGTISFGERALPRWRATLRATAWAAFDDTTTGLDTTARTLKAQAEARRDLGRRLHAVLGSAVTAPERREP